MLSVLADYVVCRVEGTRIEGADDTAQVIAGDVKAGKVSNKEI